MKINQHCASMHVHLCSPYDFLDHNKCILAVQGFLQMSRLVFSSHQNIFFHLFSNENNYDAYSLFFFTNTQAILKKYV